MNEHAAFPHDAVNPVDFRTSIGSYCSGVTVITARAPDGAMHGLTCQSFHSLSLDPPLVTYFAGNGSKSFAAMRHLDHFCVNVLADDQEELAMRFARSGTDKWTGTDWLPDIHGQPALLGAIATVSCLSHAEFDGGDHIIKVGHVRAINHDSNRLPLLYFRSQFSRLQMKLAS